MIGNEFPEILHSFIWANSNAIERFEVTSKCQGAEYSSWEKVKVASRKFDDLNHIINSCRPKVVFICNKNVQEEYFLSDNNLSHIFGLDVSDKSNFLNIHHDSPAYDYFYARDSRTHIFKLPHPHWMGVFSGIGIDKYVDAIIQDLKAFHVWEELPASADEWKKVGKDTIDPKTRKFKIIADIAHSLTLNDAFMTGKELQGIFNVNGIKTDNGCEYGSNGGRGIHKVISSAWSYYQKNKDFQTAYEIARSFVNKDCCYPYD